MLITKYKVKGLNKMFIRKSKRIITIFMTFSLVFLFTGMANASANDTIDSTFHKSMSAVEYDSGIIPLNGDLGVDFVFDESDYTNPWTAPIPSYTHVDNDDDTYVSKSRQEYDEGVVSLGEYKTEEDYTEWTAAIPTYTEAETENISDNGVIILDVGETEDSNSNPPSSEDTTLPDTSYFRTNNQTYTDYAYSPTGSGATGGSMHIIFSGDIETDSYNYASFARKVEIYIYDYDAGSSMRYKTYSSSKSFSDNFWIATLNADHRYFYRIKVVSNTLTYWNRLDGSFEVKLT